MTLAQEYRLKRGSQTNGALHAVCHYPSIWPKPRLTYENSSWIPSAILTRALGVLNSSCSEARDEAKVKTPYNRNPYFRLNTPKVSFRDAPHAHQSASNQPQAQPVKQETLEHQITPTAAPKEPLSREPSDRFPMTLSTLHRKTRLLMPPYTRPAHGFVDQICMVPRW